MPTSATRLLLNVFETVPHVMVCVKDELGRYTAVNDAFVERTTARHARDVLGRRAADLFPAHLAPAYEAQDRSVLSTGRAWRNIVELIADATGRPDWYLTTKVRTVDDGVHEVVGVSVPAQLSRGGSDRAGNLRAAVEFVQRNLAAPVRVEQIAEAAGLSTDQLKRAMHRALGVSPKQFLVRTRIDQAAYLLTTTDEPISTIATASGFYDQSQMTRQFTAIIGQSPGTYRALSKAPAQRA